MRLNIELIPATSFFTNVRSLVTQAEWDVIRKKCYKEAGYQCEICQGKGPKWPVECHEIWNYDEDTEIQKLKGLIALCPACHEVKHFGLAQVRGRHEQAKKHLMKINECTETVAHGIIKHAFARWRQRNCIDWKLDTSYLKEYLKAHND